MEVLTLPRSSLYRPTVNLFTADFNSPTPGKYDFGVAGNTLVTVQDMNPANLYVLTGISFSATVPESAYLENIGTAPRVQFFTKKAKSALFGGAFPLGRYLDGSSAAAFFHTKQGGDNLAATFTGVLNQSASLAPYPSVTAVLSLSIFEVTDGKFISEYFGRAPHIPGTLAVKLPDGMGQRI